jgi:hypothetical protein
MESLIYQTFPIDRAGPRVTHLWQRCCPNESALRWQMEIGLFDDYGHWGAGKC